MTSSASIDLNNLNVEMTEVEKMTSTRVTAGDEEEEEEAAVNVPAADAPEEEEAAASHSQPAAAVQQTPDIVILTDASPDVRLPPRYMPQQIAV